MMIRHRAVLGLLVYLACGAAPFTRQPTKPADTLAAFQKAWTPLKGKSYMRPLDDRGWKGRVEALRDLAMAGDDATGVLTDTLKKGDDETRVFAAQALAMLPRKDAQPALALALKDAHPAVRLHALNALCAFGKVPGEEPYLSLRKKDPNGDVRANAGFALERDDRSDPEALRKALADYDTKRIASAKLGEKAPDFTLIGADNKPFRLSDYRSKKAVVLVFVYGDT